ncbi:MAG: glycoside hydrolase family 3 C-terminal domain-containing protein [Clostridia bacterium]|nr:glycoside hydrolase family 3 C-terminal domain-containing protein [Clostridia bacterium]
MSQKAAKVWRGLTALFLSLSLFVLSMGGVAEQWRSVIDQNLGTTSSKTVNDGRYNPDYTNTDDLVKAHWAIGEQVGQEGAVLLKNNGALPMASGAKVTLFGMGSQYPFLGGVMGSSISTPDQVNLVNALTQKGFQVNPTMTAIYEAMGSVVTGESQGWGGKTPIYGLRPAGFSTPYAPSEPNPDTYTKSADEMGGGADANYQDSFKEYGDAAIVVFSRPGSEGSDYYPGATGIDESVSGSKSALALSANERAVLEMAKANFDKVIVLVNTGVVMEIEDLKQDEDVDAIMYVGFPGAFGFLGIANLLNGSAAPSGHLADTWAVDFAKSPAAQNFGAIQLGDTSMITWPGSLIGSASAAAAQGGFVTADQNGINLSSNYYLVEAEGIYTGYKYYETRYYDAILGQGNAASAVGAIDGAEKWDYANEVSWPFGYGMSYTTFEQKLDEVSFDGTKVTAKVTVTNTGDVAGKDVAQLYVQTPYTEYDKQHQVEKAAIQLLGMEKTQELAPGASETLTVTVDAKYMASWDSTAKEGKGGWILDGGDYYFAIGNGAHEAVNNVLAAQGVTLKMEKTSVEETPAEVTTEETPAEEVPAVETAVEEVVLGNAELAKALTIGEEGTVDETTFAKSANGTEVVNQLANADVNYYQPGYATYLSRTDWEATFPRTYNDLTIDPANTEWIQALTNEVYQMPNDGKVSDDEMNKGIPGGLTLKDLAGNKDINDPKYETLVKQIPVNTLIAKLAKGGSASDFIPEIQNPVVYQNDGPNGFGGRLSNRGNYAEDKNAGFNMGIMANETLMASTWNKELILKWGELMGNDGLMSGNWSIWGAAANTHRSAWNGRNFEYYSEDAMLSNVMCAAVIEGSLKYGVIIGPKHFAFNDQETQRSGIAPYMTEQKARENELRAFQAAYEDKGALGIMTSFSRIGATPVNGHIGLLKNILRGEWGFKGLMSTDMMNSAGYFRPEMIIASGVTQIADFSTNETMQQVMATWNYMTPELVQQNPGFVALAREAMKYQLYAFANSEVASVSFEKVTPWWETAMTAAVYGFLALGVICCAMYLVSSMKKKEEQ